MQIKSHHKDFALGYIQRLSDIRFAGQVLFVIIVLLISWSGIKTIETNYGLQKQISKLDQTNKLQKLQNENLKLQNEYFNSQQYLELSARRNFGLAAAGEKEIIVPSSVALKYAANVAPPGKTAEKPVVNQPFYQRNVQAWVDFFLHRK
ncbi:MAG: septum formation initiator family protein [Patescibacteria group bacterium]|nr:septum formation initiator family protein [Patescibacteria group bacterium]